MKDFEAKSDFIRPTIKPLLLHVGICSLLFSIYCIWFRTPLVADDYKDLLLSRKESFNYFSFGPPAARSPAGGLLQYILLKLDYLQSTFYFFFITVFAIHSASVYLVASKFVQFLQTQSGPEKRSYLLIPATVLLSFHPNFLEIIFMGASSVYVFGSLFMALTLYTNRFILLFVYGFSTLTFYESYLFPVFLLQLIPSFHLKNRKKMLRESFYRAIPLLLGFVLYLAIRFLLGQYFGNYRQPVTFEFWSNFTKILKYFFLVNTVGYAGYFSSIVEILIQIFLLFFIQRKAGPRFPRIYAVLLVIGLFSCSLDLLVPYEGIRVIYGSYFLKIAAFSLLYYVFSTYYPLRYYVFLLLFLVPIYFSNLLSLYRVRLHNYQNEKNIERFVSGIYSADEPSKTILLPPSNSVHFNAYDWALLPDDPIQYRLFRKLNNLQKDFRYKFPGVDTLDFESKDYPILYPARSFIFGSQLQWKLDPQSKSGQVFQVNRGTSGEITRGPYMMMSRGAYQLEIYLKTDGQKPDKPEFGDIAVCSREGSKKIQTLSLHHADFDGRTYRPKSFQFNLAEPENDVEFILNSVGIANFYIDFIRISRL